MGGFDWYRTRYTEQLDGDKRLENDVRVFLLAQHIHALGLLGGTAVFFIFLGLLLSSGKDLSVRCSGVSLLLV